MVRTFWRNSILVIIFSFLAGIGGVWIGLKTLPNSNPTALNLHERIHREFALDAEQKRTLHRLEERYAVSQAKYNADLKAASLSLAAAIKEHHDLSPEVVLAEQEYLSVLGHFQTETLRHIFAMRAILSPEQAKKFDDIVLRSLHDIAQ